MTVVFDLPVPGPLLGMVFLFSGLVLYGRGRAVDPGGSVEFASLGLLKIFPLLFVPAGVGVMLHGALLAREWLVLIAVLVVSTLFSMAVTALVAERAFASTEDTGR